MEKKRNRMKERNYDWDVDGGREREKRTYGREGSKRRRRRRRRR